MWKVGRVRLAYQASLWVLAVASLSATGGGAYAAAPAADSTKVEEVIVTATRREEKLQDVPVSASVLSGAPLAVIGTAGQDIRQLAYKVPSLNIESSNGRTFPRFYIRGYGNTDFNSFASQPVSLIYDDIVQENAALKGFPIFDQSDVEVLRGPQGTLFGRNTPAGVVKLESVKPQIGLFGGYVTASDGTYNTANVEGAVNIPVSDQLAFRVSAQEQHRDNWVSDPINNTHLEGYDDWAGRLQMLYQPTDSFSALLNVHGRALRGSARLFRANIIQSGSNSLVPGFDPSKIFTDGANSQTFGSIGANLHLTWSLGDIKLYSITGYESILHYFTQGDIDGGNLTGPGLIFFPVETAGGIKDHKQITQEFRAASAYAGPLNWQAGAFVFFEDVSAPGWDYNNTGSTVTDYTLSRQRNDAEAVFGSFDYSVTPQLKIRGGVRYTADHKRFDIVSSYVTSTGLPTNVPIGYPSPLFKKADASRVNWDVSGTYAVTPDVNLYARVATGFRAPSYGAPAPAAFGAPALGIQVAKAEDNTSYEGGVKADLLDHRASIDFDVYYFDLQNQQLTVVGGTANQTQLLNAKKTIGQGAELDFHYKVTPNLAISVGGSLNDTRIEDPSLAVGLCGFPVVCTVTNATTIRNGSTVVLINGNPLPQAAKWVADWTLSYTYPVGPDSDLYFYTDWSYRSKINFFLYDSKEFVGPSLLEGGLRAGYKWAAGKYDVAVFCRNCTDQVQAIGGIDFDDLTGMINDPRIVGGQLSVKF